MNDEQRQLWGRIEQFSLDEERASQPFTKRLARENRWSFQYAQRVIEEYKRFIFLGCAAGHPVSPPEDVDQAWHLHLVHTRSYWKKFCGEILGQPFHHNPSTGAPEESAKFEEWYGNTLASYRRVFGAEPPLDIWPRKQVHHELAMVDVKSHWIIRKPRASSSIALLALFGAGCGGATFGNPFNLAGPTFLVFYSIFAICVFVAAAAWRRTLIGELPTQMFDGAPTGAYELAYLNGRGVLAVTSAIVTLAEKKWIVVSAEGQIRQLQLPPADSSIHPLEQLIISETADGPAQMKEVREASGPVIQKMSERLCEKGLVFDHDDAKRARNYPMLWSLVIPLVGLIKVLVGISREKPILLLLCETIAALLIAVLIFRRVPFRTPAADELLEKERSARSLFRMQNPLLGSNVAPAIPLAVALFGMSALDGTSYSRLRKALTPKSAFAGDGIGNGDSGSSSSCGGGCGGSSSSSSSSSSCGGGSGCSSGGGSGCGGCSSSS